MTVHPITHPDPADEPDVLTFDVNTFTFGEIEEIEDVVGRDVMRELGRGTPSVKTVIAMIWIVKRRDDPAFTLDDARKIRVNAISFETPPDPKEPGG